MKKFFLLSALGLSLVGCAPEKSVSVITENQTPVQEYFGPLFQDVMQCDELFGEGKLFTDSKSFLDVVPKRDMQAILADYEGWTDKSAAGLSAFLSANFDQLTLGVDFSDQSEIDVHIKKLWKVLRREADSLQVGTLLPLKHSYQVPGGRFTEIYYWDSYFTMLGLMADGEKETVQDMVQNFADLIDAYGFIPNGNRLYYTGRSQPPFFSYMVELLARIKPDAVSFYAEQLEKEYIFWMKGQENCTADHPVSMHCVRMPDGTILNRYYDAYDTPRDEMYRNDVETGKAFLALHPEADEHQLFRDLRSGAESGWDFSSRWFTDALDLSSIHTTDIVPVDLNCLLYHLELMLSTQKEEYKERAEKRRQAVLKYCWNPENQWFMDYDWKARKQTPVMSIAGVLPLFVHMAAPEQGAAALGTLEQTFLKAGGVVTTLNQTGEQWDAPNGWAPHQWISYQAMKNYGRDDLAQELKSRWMRMVENVYLSTGKMLEKYDVIKASNTGGGEYANQDGFGWTNGVYRALQTE